MSTPAAPDVIHPEKWCVRIVTATQHGAERSSVTYGPDEEWAWKLAEAMHRHPAVNSIQVLPPKNHPSYAVEASR